MVIDDWFLTTEERGNPFTRLAHRRGGAAWSEGNEVVPIVHGAAYFARLREVIDAMAPGDLLLFTDWRGDPDERVGDDDLTLMELFARAARRGVDVRGLCWRSHADALHYSERQNRWLADGIRAAGGEVILDQRVLPLGSHHQKFVVLRHPAAPDRDVAFVGGIDLCHTRRDDAEHLGDPQPVRMGAVWGPTPAWHDLMVEVRGPAVGDVEASFRERWEDPSSPSVHAISTLDALLHRDDRRASPLPPQLPDPEARANTAVQVLRTYPDKTPRYPFAPSGERSIARGYRKALARAEGLVYLEDQYVWSTEVVAAFADALVRSPRLRLIIVLSTYTDVDTAMANASAMPARARALRALRDAGGDRVAVYGIENRLGTPVYVHAKCCIVDDVWMAVGSGNLNRRSWTHDSELTCAVIDGSPDPRAPRSQREDGEPARVLPRSVRLTLMREHLERADGDEEDLIDGVDAFEALRAAAARLDAWHAEGRRGDRPPGRLRPYRSPEIPRRDRAIGRLAYEIADDPDGRPRRLRGTTAF